MAEETPTEIFPIMEVAQKRSLLLGDTCPDSQKLREELLATVKEKGMLPYYEKYLCPGPLGQQPDEALKAQLKKSNEEELAKIEEKIADAKENLGDIEIRDAHLAKADFFNRIGDKDLALKALGAATQAKIQSESYYQNGFAAWKQQYNMSFEGAENELRQEIWAAHDDEIHQHNSEGHSWQMGHNEFSHMSWEEFRVRMGLGNVIKPTLRRGEVEVDLSAAPASIDWVSKGAVTDVKNQGQCGSCWAFSTTGSVEGALFVSSGSLVPLSEEQLVECDKTDSGCSGGLMDNAFSYIKSAGGICTEASYGYTSGSGSAGSCKKSSCTIGATVGGFTDVAQNNEAALQAAVANQPVSVAIEADQSGFQMYSGGVFSGTCGTNLDHGVLVVGYGTDGSDYWKVKNSWGGSWGESGYIRISRNVSAKEGQCGVAMQPSFPTGVAAASGPSPTPPAGDDTPTPPAGDDTPAGDDYPSGDDYGDDYPSGDDYGDDYPSGDDYADDYAGDDFYFDDYFSEEAVQQ